MPLPSRLSIVIPAYNEADRIADTLQHTIRYLSLQPYSTDILLVSDGSWDDTLTVARQTYLAQAAPSRISLRPLEYHPNRGKGYAVRYGMLRAEGDVVLFMDADYAVPLAELDKGLALLRAGYDIAIGSRAVAGAQMHDQQSRLRQAAARLYTRIQNMYLDLPFKDTQCGFKLFGRHTIKPLFAAQQLHSVIFDPEILWLARRQGYQIAEFPVSWHHHADSRIRYDSPKKFLFVFQELFRIRRLHAPDQ